MSRQGGPGDIPGGGARTGDADHCAARWTLSAAERTAVVYALGVRQSDNRIASRSPSDDTKQPELGCRNIQHRPTRQRPDAHVTVALRQLIQGHFDDLALEISVQQKVSFSRMPL